MQELQCNVQAVRLSVIYLLRFIGFAFRLLSLNQSHQLVWIKKGENFSSLLDPREFFHNKEIRLISGPRLANGNAERKRNILMLRGKVGSESAPRA